VQILLSVLQIANVEGDKKIIEQVI